MDFDRQPPVPSEAKRGGRRRRVALGAALVVVALISGVTVAVVLGVGRSDSGRAAAGGEAADGSRSQAGFDWPLSPRQTRNAAVRGVRTRSPDRAFAPLVYIHRRERRNPLGAGEFVENAALRWSNLPGCPPETLDVGALHPEQDIQGRLVSRRLGGGRMPYRYAPDAPDCDPPSRPVSFLATELTRPYSTRGRPARLPEPQGLYLDLRRDATDGRGGSESVGWAATRLHDVPVYFERRHAMGTGADLAITYWMLYAMSEPRTASGSVAKALAHQGDWETVTVLLRRLGRRLYRPIALVFDVWGERRRVSWGEVARVANSADRRTERTSHPVLHSARGSHTTYLRPGDRRHEVKPTPGSAALVLEDRAMACRVCPQWRTWRDLSPVRDQPWYGFGGAWGRVGATDATTGELGPSRYRR